MRKRSSRKVRPVAKLISPRQLDELMVVPRLHLQLLLAGQAELYHLRSLASAFNLGATVAYLAGRGAIQLQFHAAQRIIVDLVAAGAPYSPSADTAMSITDALNALDAYLGVQNNLTLLRALDYIDKAVAAGAAVSMESVNGQDK